MRREDLSILFGGIRAGVCSDRFTAKMITEHNPSNENSEIYSFGVAARQKSTYENQEFFHFSGAAPQEWTQPRTT